MKRNDNRQYRFEVILYDTTKSFVPLLNDIPYLRYFLLSPLHDKDLKDDNTPVKPHFHLFCTFNRKFSFKALSALLSSSLGQNILPENIAPIHNSLEDCYLYAFHSNSDKAQYDEKDIVSNNLSFFKLDYTIDNIAYNILCDLENKVPLKILARKYGKDLIYHYNQYKEFLYDMQNEHINGCSHLDTTEDIF